MPTHERNVLMWLIRCIDPHFWEWLRLVLFCICVFTLALWLLGCGLLKSPTAPEEEPELHPSEILVTEHTQCYADYFRLGKITCSFFEDERLIDCSDDWGNDENGDPVECIIVGGAFPGSRHAEYYGPWVRGELAGYSVSSQDLEWVAAHEVCHMAGTWSETVAKRCAEIAWDQAQCHEGGFQPVLGIDPRLMF